MKRIKSVNGYTIFQAVTQRDADNYNCQVGNYNIYIAQDIRDFGLSNSYPEYDRIETLAEALNICRASNFAIACALADELSDSTVQDMDLCLEIERRLDAGEAVDSIRDCYDEETGYLYAADDLWGRARGIADSLTGWAGASEEYVDEVFIRLSEGYSAACIREHWGDIVTVVNDRLAPEDDVVKDEDITEEELEKLFPTPKPRSHATYAVLLDDEGHYLTISKSWSESLDTQEKVTRALLATVALHYVFNDCGGLDVEEIVVDGRHVEYCGWMPGIEVMFRDCETGEIVFDECFPEWDH